MTRRRLGTRIALVLLGICLALVLAEIVCRVDAFFPGRKYSSAGARAWFAARADSDRALEAFAAADPHGASLHLFPHPFQGWTDERSFAALEEETLWYADTAASDKSFDVLVLGGSVAAVFGNLATPKLVATLEADPRLAGRSVRVWNGGNAGYKAPQPVHSCEWMMALGHRPDAIVLIDGFNEVAIAASNLKSQVHPLYPYAEHWGPLARGEGVDVAGLDILAAMRAAQRDEQSIARAALARGWDHSALLTRITLSRLSSRHLAFEKARAQYTAYLASSGQALKVHGPAFAGGPEAAVDLAVRAWSESARALHALCVQHGIVELHVLQPTLADPGAKKLTEDEVRGAAGDVAWKTAVQRGYPALRAAGAELAAQGIPFDDASRVFEHETGNIYIDVCHYDERGNDLLCDYVLSVLGRRLR